MAVKIRPGSTCCLKTVSCSIEYEEKRKELGISPSAAYKRGLQFFFAEAEGKSPQDELIRKIARLSQLLDYSQKELFNLKRLKGGIGGN